jgi:preprotein translocase subunit SecG
MILALQITLIVTSLLVILLVLLHRAKGGGLSTLFGGGVQSSLSGSTVVEKNLDRVTLFVTGIWVVSIVGVALQIKFSRSSTLILRPDEVASILESWLTSADSNRSVRFSAPR